MGIVLQNWWEKVSSQPLKRACNNFSPLPFQSIWLAFSFFGPFAFLLISLRQSSVGVVYTSLCPLSFSVTLCKTIHGFQREREPHSLLSLGRSEEWRIPSISFCPLLTCRKRKERTCRTTIDSLTNCVFQKRFEENRIWGERKEKSWMRTRKEKQPTVWFSHHCLLSLSFSLLDDKQESLSMSFYVYVS